MGDCGSWVFDAVSGEPYGHIIAGSTGFGSAYIVPLIRELDIDINHELLLSIIKINIEIIKANFKSTILKKNLNEMS